MNLVMKPDERLLRHGIKPTANRILVIKAIDLSDRAVSLFELESLLDTVDKSTIYRILCLFVEHGLLHVIDDGSGSVKYEICTAEEVCSVDDMHPHFYCEVCHRTLCLKTIRIPVVYLSDDYKISSINYVIKGVCPDCSR